LDKTFPNKGLSLQDQVKVRISRATEGTNDVALPVYATDGSAGMDVCAAVDSEVRIDPLETKLIPTGFSIELPNGYEAQIRPRSGLALKHQVGILNSPGTIDSDYRGEVKILLTNFGREPFTVRRGDRVAQMVVHRYSRVEWEEVERVNETSRGAGGFGHTGITSMRK
jgi:dUTP pyrophosphatase